MAVWGSSGVSNEREITKEEVKRALNETKGGKAPGIDGVRAEMLKEGGVTALEWLVSVFNICLRFGSVGIGKGEDGMSEAADTIGQRGALLPPGSLEREGPRIGR